MWAFLSRRFRQYLLLALAAPVAAWVLLQVGEAIEARRGESTLTRILCAGGRWLQQRTRGPLSDRGRSGSRRGTGV
jgi:hypothetical protein